MNFKQWLEVKIEPCGECFRWSFSQITKDDSAKLVHGLVTPPFSNKPPYWHAWIEKGDLVKDWQTMEAKIGGKFAGKGYPKNLFYELYQPKNIRKYSTSKAIEKWVQSKSPEHPNGHMGPW